MCRVLLELGLLAIGIWDKESRGGRVWGRVVVMDGMGVFFGCIGSVVVRMVE